jgi:hypothetical protein
MSPPFWHLIALNDVLVSPLLPACAHDTYPGRQNVGGHHEGDIKLSKTSTIDSIVMSYVLTYPSAHGPKVCDKSTNSPENRLSPSVLSTCA